MATAIPTACLARSAIRCRDVETGPNLGVLAVFPSNGAMYCPRVLGQWFDGIRFYAAASSPTRSRRTWAGLR